MHLRQPARLVEGTLPRLVIGEQDELPDALARGEHGIHQRAPYAGAVAIGVHQNVLRVDDRVAVADGARQVDQIAISLTGTEDPVRSGDGASE